MRLRELIVLEDGEGGATVSATTSADIATVAYPLFVRGATRKQKRKNARAAVGQRYVPGPAYIGQGVFEGVAEGLENYNGIQLSLEIQKDDEFVDDDDTDNQTIFVQATANGRELGQVVFAIDYDAKGMILVPQDLEVDERFRSQGIAATMYDYVKSKGYRIHRSSDQTPAGAGFWDKHKPGKDIWEQGVAEGSLEDRLKKYVRPTVKTTPKIERTTNPAGRTTDHVEWKVTGPMGDVSRFTSKKAAQAHFDSFGMAENSLNEFAPGAGDEGGGEDPYRYPKPEHFSRSIDFFGQFEAEHFDREDMNDATGEFKGYWGKDQIAYFKFDNPKRTGNDDPGMGWYYEPNADSSNNNSSAKPTVDNTEQRKQQELSMIRAFLKSGQTPEPGSQIYSLMKRHGMSEAHVLNHDNVIYRLDKENPMSDTEVAVLGGAGRYSLKGLRDKARREASALAQDLSIEHGGAFRRSAENIKQLTNTINTIVAAYNELARLRRRGGRGSRGITDEDTNFIRECIRVVEQAAQNYRLMEGTATEPDAVGYQNIKLTNPKYAVVVDTPSDYDWYKIGNHWHDRKIDPHEFGQEDSDTIMVGYGEADFKNMLAKLDKMGFTYKQIGGTHSQPEIHKGRKE